MIEAAPEKNPEMSTMLLRFWISVALCIPIVILHMGMFIPGIASLVDMVPPVWSAWLRLVLATPVVFWCGWPIFSRAWSSLLHRNLNMYTLIALGTGIAYVYSVVAVLYPDAFPPEFRSPDGPAHEYFEAAAVIMVLVLMGQVLELRGREKTFTALRQLLDLAPKMASRINESGGAEERIPLCHVHVNDVLRVRPGEKVPVDGKVIGGHGVIDESIVTGEFLPMEKLSGDTVIGGTMNITGSFIMRADRVGKETLLAQIVKQVSDAQRSRAPIQHLADQVASYFVPAVMAVAVLTFLIWTMIGPHPAMTYGLISAITVLIIACPCALGLATPMSIMVGMGRGAQAGILIKNAETLERFEDINALVFDKTGTLTVGRPKVTTILHGPDFTNPGMLFLAASLEMDSEHPLAGAIVQAALAQGMNLETPENFRALPGKGISGIISGREVLLGSINYITELGYEPGHWLQSMEELSAKGEYVIFVVVDRQVAGLISVADSIKESAHDALQALRDIGMYIVMVTGDHRITANALAKQLSIDAIEAEVLPQKKTEIVRKLREMGYSVAMAGDGVNDAAALASADIGIAMGTGADIAMQSASVTLVKGDLMGIARAYRLSRCVMRNIRQNLFLAFVYNILCVPIAAGLLYPFTGTVLNPVFAAAAMSLSSVSVIANAYRLRKVKL